MFRRENIGYYSLRKYNMDSSLNTPTSRKPELGSIQHKRKIPFTMLAVLLVLVHFVFLMSYFEPAISTPDANSYFAQAKLIAKEGKTYLEPESALQYVGPHWKHTIDNRYYCIHPPGLATILSVVYAIFGPKATLWVNPLMASLSLLGLFLLCRLWIGEGWALLAVALMAVNPFANEHALFGDSHTAIVFCLIWALFFVAQWARTRSAWYAFGAGLFMGIIPTIRHPELLYLPAIGLFVFLHFKNNRIFWRSLVAGAIGAAIPISALCIHNQMAYGAFWKTGFSIVGEQMSLFDWKHLARYGPQYVQKLMNEGCALTFVLGVAGIAALCARRRTWKQGMLFAVLVLPITVLYMSFFWGPDPQSMRYLLPTFYIYTIAAVWLLYLLAVHYHRTALAISIALLLTTAWWGIPLSVRSMQHLKRWNGVLAQVTSTLEQHVERGSILITNEGINQHLDFIGYWRLVDSSILRSQRPRPPRMVGANRNSLIIPPQAPRNVEAHREYGNLAGQKLYTAFSNDVWLWAGEKRRVYWIAKEDEIKRHEGQLSHFDRFVKIAEIELPAGSWRNIGMAIGPQMNPKSEFVSPPQSVQNPTGPHGPNHIFDLVLDGEPLFLVEWSREP